MINIFEKLEGLWNDKRAEFSNEVSHKEKTTIYQEVAKNQQVNSMHIL